MQEGFTPMKSEIDPWKEESEERKITGTVDMCLERLNVVGKTKVEREFESLEVKGIWRILSFDLT